MPMCAPGQFQGRSVEPHRAGGELRDGLAAAAALDAVDEAPEGSDALRAR